MKPRKRQKRRIRKEVMYAWNERDDIRSPQSDETRFSAQVIDFQKLLARKLQKMRLEYIEQHHKEPELTDFERGLIAKYC